jgi:hypothetical protein
VTVGNMAARVGYVDVSVGVLRMRLGLADEHAALEAACTTVLHSRDNHLSVPHPKRVFPAGPSISSTSTILASVIRDVETRADDHAGTGESPMGTMNPSMMCGTVAKPAT